MSTLYLTKPAGLPVNLPKANTGTTQAQSEIMVTIDQQGQISLNRQSVQLNDLPIQ